jgi:predicted RNA binding protein YcfA (HicA-like mRNA interferase family)
MVSYIIIDEGDLRMSQWDKLLERIKSLSADIRFEELQKVLESYGYTMDSPHGGSSHHTFRKVGCAAITIPKHKTIKKAYVKLVREVIESEERNNE